MSIAIRLSLKDIMAEYQTKREGITEAVNTFNSAFEDAKLCANIGGAYGGPIHSGHVSLEWRQMEDVLLKSAWRHVYAGLQIENIAGAKDRKSFELFFENPDPFTLENIRERFGDYLIDPRWHMLKSMAECFCNLDPAYKSHSKVKIGVEGLPKRIIIKSVNHIYGYGFEQVKDVLNVLNSLNRRPRIQQAEISDFLRGDLDQYHGISIKRFNNGNAHLIFDPDTRLQINRALSEFYGAVLPDTPQETTHRTGTAVSKDLAYYPTPKAASEALIGDVYIKDGHRVLEPSCGDGRLMQVINPKARVVGVEVDPKRAEEARQKGFSVLTANFLEVPPKAEFDFVIMNPPFCGKHYQQHVEHAKKFLKPDGVLRSVLPATAYYDHGFCKRHEWRDLPVASFHESGTNVPTGIYTWRNK